jgi:hypothetical protein
MPIDRDKVSELVAKTLEEDGKQAWKTDKATFADQAKRSPAAAAAVAKKIGESMATETGDRAPDELGVVTGWRAWRVDPKPDDDGQVLLHSVSHSYFWVPFEKARASCSYCEDTDPRSPHCTPGEACGCGFYCARTLSHLRSLGYHTYNPESNHPTIVGRVACWGKVIPGTQGWRAEYAYPDKLFVPFEFARKLARPVADTYGVPVQLMNLLDPSAKPGSKRGHGHVIAPQTAKPKFMEDYARAHRMPGFEDAEDEEDGLDA